MGIFGPKRAVAKMGSHIACFENSDIDTVNRVAPMIKDGLKNKEKCIIAGPEEIIKRFKEKLSSLGVNVEKESKKGSLMMTSDKKMFLKNKKVFDPHYILGMLKNILMQSLKEGYKGLRFTADAVWMGGVGKGKGLLLHKLANAACKPGAPLIVICQHNTGKVSSYGLIETLKVHPFALVGGVLEKNPYYIKE